MKMRLAIALLPVSLLLVGCQGQDQTIKQADTTGYKAYGAPITPAAPMTLAQLVDKADTLGEKRVCVRADIQTVCQTRGCWMTLSDGDHSVRVRFTASDNCKEGYFVPRNADGHKTFLVGKVMCTEISEADARHYAGDVGKSKEEIAKIVGPQKEVTLLAEGVLISDGNKLDEPAS